MAQAGEGGLNHEYMEATSQNARLAHSFMCATCSRWYTPPMTSGSSLQSNWNASPSSKLSGT